MLPASDLVLLSEPLSDATLPETAVVEAAGFAGGRATARRWSAKSAASTVASVALHLGVLALFISAPEEAWRLAGMNEDGKTLLGDAAMDRSKPAAVDVAIVAPPKPAAAAKPSPPPAQPKPQQRPETPKRQILAAPPVPNETAPDTVPPEPGPAAREKTDVAAVPVPTPRPEPDPSPQRPASTASRSAEAARPAKPPGQEANASGRSQADERRGTIGGWADGTAASANTGTADDATGDAAVSDYPGTIARKLNAALSYPAEASRRKVKGQARVQFVIDASGRVGSVEVVTSSGSAILDRAAIETVRRAAPFPPIPMEAGRTQWPFKVTLAFGR